MRSAVLLLLLLVLAAPAVGQPDKLKKRDPFLNGKTIAEWTTQLEKGKDTAKMSAVSALMRAGPEARPAVPALINLLAAEGVLRFLAPIVLSRVGPEAMPALQKALTAKDAATRSGAALALGLIGEEAAPATTALTEALKDTEASVRRTAATALGQIGPAARRSGEALQAALKDKDRSVAVEAARSLWRVAKDATGTDALAKACSDKDEGLVLNAVQGLTEMGAAAAEATGALRGLLKHKEAEIRLAAAVALARVTASGDEALPVLESALADKEETTALLALGGLGQVPGDKAAALLLRQAFGDKPPRRREALAALAGRSDLKTALPSLLAGLNDPAPEVRWWCAVALAAAGERGPEELMLHALRATPKERALALDVVARERIAVPLTAALKAAPARYIPELARAAGEAGAAARPAAAELLALLGSEDKLTRRAAADALPNLGVDLLPVLFRQLKSESAATREGAARALGGFGLPARSAMPTLVAQLRGADAPERTQCALALWRIDDQSEAALGLLDVVIRDVDAADRWEALEAVGILAVEAMPRIRGLMEVLVNALKDRDPRMRATASKWLWKRTRSGTNVVPLLRDIATNRDAFTRQIVIETLGEIKEEPGVVSLLVSALEDRDVLVRVAAERGLANVAAVSEVVKLLSSKKGRSAAAAVRVLGLMGPSAKEALPELAKRALTDEDARAALGRVFPGKHKQLAAYLDALKAGKDTTELLKALN